MYGQVQTVLAVSERIAISSQKTRRVVIIIACLHGRERSIPNRNPSAAIGPLQYTGLAPEGYSKVMLKNKLIKAGMWLDRYDGNYVISFLVCLK